MKAVKSIMMATDFSERSDRALRRATLLARSTGASLSLVHVIDDDQPRRIIDNDRAAAETLLQEAAATLSAVDGLQAGTRILLADPFEGIAIATREARPDLLVMGPHRRHLLKDIFIGTTAERVIRSAACPVLMVNAAPVAPYRHILLTTDLSEIALDALKDHARLGLCDNAALSALHIFPAPALRLSMGYSLAAEGRANYLEEESRAAAQKLAGHLAKAGLAHARQILRPEETTAGNDILRTAAEIGSDLIVVSTHGRTGMAKLLLGSATEHVLRAAPVDVLAIPPAPAAA